MKNIRSLYISLFVLTFMLRILGAEKVVLVIMDGARYSETFGDVDRTYIPRLDSLSQYGTILDQFYNDSLTYTSRAVPALWCGAWTGVRDTTYNGGATQYTLKPSLFEYFRKQTGASADQAIHVLKYVPTLWLPSFHPEYGPDYWPTVISNGSTDEDVLDQALNALHNTHPQLLLVYLAGVDQAGHSGDWDRYTRAITVADSVIDALWREIQIDSLYANQTTLLVTNDHGRHDDAHGGFTGHGDGCEGCRHIMFFAIGPQIKQGEQTSSYRSTPDFAVTAAHLLGVNPEYSTGHNIEELFIPIGTKPETPSPAQPTMFIHPNFPNPFNSLTRIVFDVYQETRVSVNIYDVAGQYVVTLLDAPQRPGQIHLTWDGKNHHDFPVSSGLYFIRIRNETTVKTLKALLLE